MDIKDHTTVPGTSQLLSDTKKIYIILCYELHSSQTLIYIQKTWDLMKIMDVFQDKWGWLCESVFLADMQVFAHITISWPQSQWSFLYQHTNVPLFINVKIQ